MRKNYWPHAIIISIILIIISCISTILVAVNNPVQLDTFYLDKYQSVDEKINEIQASQKRFSQNFDIKFLDFNSTTDRKFSFEIIPKNGAEIKNLRPTLMLTRPDTNEFNQDLNVTLNGVSFVSQDVKFAKLGRWQILLKITDLNDTGFYKYDIFIE
ncbi:MAG: FixH family protein [Campylobacter sp.]